MPPHLGHDHLIHTAKAQVEGLTVLVASRPGDPIDANQRASWLRQMHPDIDVCVVSVGDLPPRGAGESYWRALLRAVSEVLEGQPIDVVFASDRHARRLADGLSAKFALVDPERRDVPISGTMIRQAPLEHWAFIPPCVRPHYVRRICLLGAEGSGKSTLARQLAGHFGTRYVEEYARPYAAEHGQDLSVADFEAIARQQIMLERAERQSAERLLFCDTEVLSIALWCERLHGAGPAWLFEAAYARPDTLYLVCAPDLPYRRRDAFGDQRDRRRFFDRCLEEVDGRWPHAVIRGEGEARVEGAIAAIGALLDLPEKSVCPHPREVGEAQPGPEVRP